MPEKTLFINSQYGHSLSTDGSTFSMDLKPPLIIPKGAVPMVSVVEAGIFHTAHNIKAGVNDVFKMSFSNVAGNALQTMTLAPGIYNLSSLNLILGHFLVDLGLARDTLKFVGVQATSSLLLHVIPNTASGNVTVNWTDSTMTMRTFLGYEDNPSVTFTQEGTVSANKTAKFDSIQYYVLECANGLNVQGVYTEDGSSNSTSLAAIVPDVAPSQQILYRPNHPLRQHANISGGTISRLEFRLCDHLHNPVDTNDEFYNARIKISW